MRLQFRMLDLWSACLRLTAGRVLREIRDTEMYTQVIRLVLEVALPTQTRRELFLALRRPRAKMLDFLDDVKFKNLVYNA